MDKKNTMLLTVIAVATLLVAVVGATFAYFTASNTNDGKTTVVTGQTTTIAAVGLTNPTSNLYITLTATEMAQDESLYKAYWATNSAKETGVANYEAAATQRPIAVATVETGGDATAKYTCTANVTFVVEGAMASALVKDDAYVQFGGLLTNKVDLADVYAAEGHKYTAPVTFNLDNTTNSQNVTAALAIANRDADQTVIAGKGLTVTFSNTDFSCTVVK